MATKRKFTKSIDGEMRCSYLVPLRLTEEELKDCEDMAKALGHKSFREYAVIQASTIPEMLWIDYSEREE